MDLNSLVKKYPAKLLPNGNIRLMPCRLSFPSLDKPKSFKNADGSLSEPKYQCSLIIPLQADITLLKEQAAKVLKETFGEKWKDLLKLKKLHWPILEQATQVNDDGELWDGFSEEGYFLRVASKRRPALVGPDMSPISPDEMYGGAIVIATVRPFSFGTEKDAKKRGVSYGLQNIQKFGDDERFGGGSSRPDDDFEPLDASLSGEAAFSNGDTDEFGIGN